MILVTLKSHFSNGNSSLISEPILIFFTVLEESGTLDRIRTTESIKTEGPNFYDHKTDPEDRIFE